MRASIEQKENRDKAPNGSRTPRGKSSSKGTKNFMAPTISASSKVISASPAKKIFGERNEVISVSRSLELPSMGAPASRSETLLPSEGDRIEEIESKSEMGFSGFREIPGSGEESIDPKINYPEFGSKSEMGAFGFREIPGSGEKCFDSEIKKPESFVPPSSLPSPMIAPLDADPSLPPYDPKTNYLSPRPLFLHYKPNPRLERHFDEDQGFSEIGYRKNLDDSFSSESFEETSENTEEAQSSPMRQQEPEVEESYPPKGKVALVSLTKTNTVSESDDVQFEPRYSMKSKILPLVLVLNLVCLLAPLSDCPLMPSSYSTMEKNYSSMSLYNDSYVKDYANLAYLNTGDHFLLKQQLGSSDLLLDQTVGFNSICSSTDLQQDQSGTETTRYINEEESTELEVSEVKEEDDEREYKLEEMAMEVSEDIEEDDLVFEAHRLVNEVHEEERGYQCHEAAALDIEESSKEQERSPIEEDHPLGEERGNEIEGEVCGTEAMDSKEESSRDPMIEFEIVENQEEGSDINLVNQSQQEIHSDTGEEYQQISTALELRESPETGSKDKLSMRDIGITCSVLALFATISAFCYMKQKKTSDHERLQPSPPKEATLISCSGKSYSHEKVSLLQNHDHERLQPSPPKKVVFISCSGESYSHEMGDSGHSLSMGRQRTKRGKEEDEALINEQRLRRDSGVSSSISYGSFITYDRLSGKKGGRDEGSVTPVRRSSRIQNRLTSPS